MKLLESQIASIRPTLAIIGFLTLAAAEASAQDAGGSDKLRMLGRCQGCTFENLNLSGQKLMLIDLRDSQFRNVDFSDAQMSLANFNFAVLEEVSFASADLAGASFIGARLINVSFEGANLVGAVFEGAILEGTDLQAGRLCTTQMPNDFMDNSDCD